MGDFIPVGKIAEALQRKLEPHIVPYTATSAPQVYGSQPEAQGCQTYNLGLSRTLRDFSRNGVR